MSGIDEALSITAPGLRLTSGATTANTAIPLTSGNTLPRYIRLLAETSGSVNVRLGGAGVVATTSDVLVNANEPLVLATNGSTYIAYIQNSAGGIVNVMPIEF